MSWYRGVLGGDRFWFRVGMALFAARLVSRIWSKEPQVVAVERLAPGQSIQITSIAPAKKKRS